MSTSDSPPNLSRTSSSSSMKRKKPLDLTLDLTDLPPLSQPSEPTNTLIITNLNDPTIFAPDSLDAIRTLLSQSHPIHTFSPLKSFRRLLVSFADPSAAVAVRAALDGEDLLGSRIRVYFGTPTPLGPIDPATLHLQAPKSDKLFFISPPPSPPAGWAMRNEDPPNRAVHAHDLSAALRKLHGATADTYAAEADAFGWVETSPARRSRSATVVYRPEDHGDSPHLPAIAVEDTGVGEAESPEGVSPIGSGFPTEIGEGDRKWILHTSRPPLEVREGSG